MPLMSESFSQEELAISQTCKLPIHMLLYSSRSVKHLKVILEKPMLPLKWGCLAYTSRICTFFSADSMAQMGYLLFRYEDAGVL